MVLFFSGEFSISDTAVEVVPTPPFWLGSDPAASQITPGECMSCGSSTRSLLPSLLPSGTRQPGPVRGIAMWVIFRAGIVQPTLRAAGMVIFVLVW